MQETIFSTFCNVNKEHLDTELHPKVVDTTTKAFKFLLLVFPVLKAMNSCEIDFLKI